MISEELYEYAKKRVSKRRKFYSHVIMWLVMSIFFILINLATADYFWAIFPILFWGIGVAFHGIRVFSSEWEDDEVDREYEKLHKRRGYTSSHADDLDGARDVNDVSDKDFV